MAKFDLRFLCLSEDGSYIKAEFFQDHDLTVRPYIDVVAVDEDGKRILIQLDKSTAIKFAKTLRTEINKIES